MKNKKTITDNKRTIYAYVNFFKHRFMKNWILENTPIKEVTNNPLYDLQRYYDEIVLSAITDKQVRKQYSHLLILTKYKKEIEV
jgi:hypothetical protein